jgi:hypothetical protein
MLELRKNLHIRSIDAAGADRANGTIRAGDLTGPLPFRRRSCFDQTMGVQPIHIETLGDLVAHGYGMNAMCSRCRHRRDLDMGALIARLGPTFVMLARPSTNSCCALPVATAGLKHRSTARTPAFARGSPTDGPHRGALSERGTYVWQ